MVATPKKVTAPKVAKVAKPVVKKAAPEHPKFSVMITEAIKTLADRKGSSKIAIQKYVAANYKVEGNYERSLKKSLKAALEDKTLTKPKGVGLTGSFKLTKVEKPKAVKKPLAKKVVKKPVAKKIVKKPAAKTVVKKVMKTPTKKLVAKKASPVKKGKVAKKVVKKPVAKKATKTKK